jgi:cyanate lyase
MPVTGLDGCRNGWAAVDLGDDGRLAGIRLGPALDTLLAGTPAGQVVGIDMPLGLLADGWRAADREARALLGARRSSVFAIPPGPVWQEASYRAANERCRALTGSGLSAQAWGLQRKLLEANDYRLRCRHPLYEVHPELSFSAMAGAPLRYPKRLPAGAAERRGLLAAAGIVIPPDGPWSRVTADVLDAAAVAWTARRIALGRAGIVPDPPQTDRHGHEIAIRYLHAGNVARAGFPAARGTLSGRHPVWVPEAGRRSGMAVKEPAMTKKEAAEAVRTAKARLGLTWAQLAEAVGRPLAWTTSALLGQHPMSRAEAEAATSLLDLDDGVRQALELQPTRGALDSPVPTDPTIYRFYEVLQVYGPTIKELIHEQFGDGIMSAINFRLDVRRDPDPAGDRVVVTLDGKFLPYQW